MAQPSPAKRRQWKSLGSDKEIKAEAAMSSDDGPRMVVHFAAPREIFVKRRTQLPHNAGFNPKDAMEDPKDLRSSKIDGGQFELSRMECDIGTQAGVKQVKDAATETPYYRRINACVQATPTIVDARLQPGKEEEKMDYATRKFVDKVMPRMLHHLSQNNEVPIFGDDYLNLTEEDTFVASREDNFLREAGNFSHIHTKQKHITSIDWRSITKQSVICISCINAVSLPLRLDQQCLVECSVCLVWDLADHMHPQYVLESPNEVLVVKFNPQRSNIIVGGTVNGQIVMWDTSRAQDTTKKHTGKHRPLQQREEDVTLIPPMPEPIRGHSFEKDGDAMVSRLQPSQISSVRSSHRRPVHDLCWIPDGLEMGFDGKLSQAQENSQFASISEDGTMLIWDLDPEKLPQDRKRKRKQQGKDSADEWLPLMKYTLTKPDGSGDILGLRFHLEGRVGGVPSYLMCCTSIEGELCVCNYAPKDDKTLQPQNLLNEAAVRKEGKMVKTISQAHAGAAWAVRRHPQLQDYYLTVGDWGFKVWKLGLPSPIIISPSGEAPILCGRWSPTRASVIFVGTNDGYVDVWDLLDRSHEPVLRHQIGQDAITVIEFKPVSSGRSRVDTQIVAVGTKAGSFHLFELPKVLFKSQSNELRNVRNLFEREVRHVSYFQWRWKERQKEMDRNVQEKAEQMTAEKEKKPARVVEDEEQQEDLEYLADPEADEKFLKEVEELTMKEEELKLQDQE